MKKLTIAAFAALALGGAFVAFAQDKSTTNYFPDSLVQEKTGPTPESCRQMMSDMAGMADTQGAQDRKIDLLVATMNETTGDSKANATAAVVTELVVQRSSNRGMQRRMDEKMHMHMMQHSKSGRMNCPMMGGMQPAQK